MNYSDARKAIREAILVLMELDSYAVGSLVMTEYQNAQRKYRARHWEHGPGWEVEPEHCNCEAAGRWGATGNMPLGHIWYWRASDHRSGYLAHAETGQKYARFRCHGCGQVIGSDKVDDHKDLHGLVTQITETDKEY